MSQATRRWWRDRGTATVEFALVAPLLLMLVFGIVDFGRMAAARVELTAAAHAGAQALASRDPNPLAAARAAAPSLTVRQGSATSCPNSPGTGTNARYTAVANFEFITPLAAFIGSGSPSQMQATGAVPCRA